MISSSYQKSWQINPPNSAYMRQSLPLCRGWKVNEWQGLEADLESEAHLVIAEG